MSNSIHNIDQITLTRNRIAQAIDGLLMLLDNMDGDADFESTGDDEPYLSSGAAVWNTQGGQSDREHDDAYYDNPVAITGGQGL